MIVLDRKHPLTRGLLMDVALIERGGSVVRNTVNGGQGTISDGTWAKGSYGWYLSFDGSGGYATWDDRPYFGRLQYITVEILMSVAGGGGGNYGGFFALGDNAAGDDWFGLQFDNYSSGWGMRINTMYDDRERVWSIPNPTLNQWDHYVFLYDHTNYANTPVVIKNGRPITVTDRYSGSWTNPLTVDTFRLARTLWTGGDQTGNVKIAYCRLWNRILPLQSARSLYGNPWQIYKRWNSTDMKWIGKAITGVTRRIFSVT